MPLRAGLPANRIFLAAALLAALSALALTIDLPVARMFQTGHIPRDLHHLVRLGESFGWGGTVALIILMAATLDCRGWRVVPRLATAAFGAGLLANCIKLLVARQRPADMDLQLSVGQTFVGWRTELATGGLSRIQSDALNSFPSGHTATATGLAVALSMLYPRGRWLFAFLAALAAFQRLEFRAHYLSDVLAGAALGCLVGAICQLDFGIGHWLAKIEQHKPSGAPGRT
jgi:membrane-associated phospholipid phosphatase